MKSLAPDPPSPWTAGQGLLVLLGAHIVLVLGGSAVLEAGGWSTPLPIEAQFSALIPFWIAGVGLSWWLVRHTGGAPVIDLRLSVRWIDVPLGIAVGVVTQLVVIPLVYWPIFRVFDTNTDDLEQIARDLADSSKGAVGTLLFVLMTCVAAPIVEEILYRGVVLRGFEQISGRIGLVASSVLFGALHLEPLQFVGLTIFGFAAGYLVQRTGRLGPAVIAHVAFNATTVIGLLART